MIWGAHPYFWKHPDVGSSSFVRAGTAVTAFHEQHVYHIYDSNSIPSKYCGEENENMPGT